MRESIFQWESLYRPKNGLSGPVCPDQTRLLQTGLIQLVLSGLVCFLSVLSVLENIIFFLSVSLSGPGVPHVVGFFIFYFRQYGFVFWCCSRVWIGGLSGRQPQTGDAGDDIEDKSERVWSGQTAPDQAQT